MVRFHPSPHLNFGKMKKLLNLFGIIIWIILASYRLRLAIEIGSILPLLLAIQSGVIAYFLAVRVSSKKTGPLYQQIFAFFAVFAPFVIRVRGNCGFSGETVALIGTFITLWALFNLGKSFGISPADRKLVDSGPYKYVRHPMYSGELLTMFGTVLGCVSAWNLSVVFFMFFTLYIRIVWEEKLITGYGSYKNRVRWRLIPWLW